MGIADILVITIRTIGEIIMWLILIRIILSMFNLSMDNPFNRFFIMVTEPILMPVRRLIARFTKGSMMIDFSPIVAWLLIDYIIVPWLSVLVRFIFK